MKLKSKTKILNKLLGLQWVKSKFHKNCIFSKTNNRADFHFKKFAQLIYHYDSQNKRILFLGFPVHFSAILKDSKHVNIANFVRWKNLIQNNNKKNFPFKTIQLLFSLKKKIDLIILCHPTDRFNNLKIPVISILNNINLFCSIVKITLKKAILRKYEWNYKNFLKKWLNFKKRT